MQKMDYQKIDAEKWAKALIAAHDPRTFDFAAAIQNTWPFIVLRIKSRIDDGEPRFYPPGVINKHLKKLQSYIYKISKNLNMPELYALITIHKEDHSMIIVGTQTQEQLEILSAAFQVNEHFALIEK
jgi:hypothetical protein